MNSSPVTGAQAMNESLRSALALAAKDLRLEFRTRTALVSALMFAVLTLLVFVFSRDQSLVSTADLAPSALWITVAFSAVVAMNRGFIIEREAGAFDALLLAPMPRGAIYWGKLLANLAFVGLVEALTLPLFVLFFNVPVGGALPGLVATLALATVGFVAVGTIVSAMAVRTRFAELMLPVLVLPFLVPPLIGAVQMTSRLLGGRPLTEVMGWLRLLVTYDVVFLVLGTLAFTAVVDE
ncbi:MAG: heme exporter protein CcmB [Gemmatimonadales bacterium]